MHTHSEVVRTRTLAKGAFWAFITVCLVAPSVWADVQLSSVEQIERPGAPTLYRVDYIYDFRSRNSVYIDGVGTVPAQGHFRYQTDNPILLIRESQNGKLLANLDLRQQPKKKPVASARLLPPATMLAAAPPSTPTNTCPVADLQNSDNHNEVPSQLPPSSNGRTAIWHKSSLQLPQKLNDLLNNCFFGYTISQDEKGFSIYQSSFDDLSKLSQNLQAQFSLIVKVFSRSSQGDNSLMHSLTIQYYSRERRAKDKTWRANISDETETLATRVAKDFSDLIESEGK